MSNTNKPLTAEDFIQLNAWPLTGEEIQQSMEKYAKYKAAQQTAALREELHEISSKKASMEGDYILQVRALQQELEAAKLKAQSAEWQEEQNSKACQALIHAAAKERDQAKEELEALKRERDALRDDVRRLCIIISKKDVEIGKLNKLTKEK